MGGRLKLGLVGAGVVLERYHIPAINAVPEVERAIVIDADAERARRVAERYNFPRYSTISPNSFATPTSRLSWFPMASTLPFPPSFSRKAFTSSAKSPWPAPWTNVSP